MDPVASSVDALSVGIGGFACLLAGAWAAGEHLAVEAILVATLNGAFAVEAELHAASAAQEQQARLLSTAACTAGIRKMKHFLKMNMLSLPTLHST
jgi:hypothetical protein